MRLLTLGLLAAASIAQAQSQEEMAFAHSVLNALQPRSIAEGREYCGFIGLDHQGRFVATPATAGDESSCDIPDAPESIDVIASYHTHGRYSEDYENEVPSETDVVSDYEAGTNGYISTPGGRLWYVDGKRRMASQICPDTCVFADPNGVDEGNIPRRLTLHQIRTLY
jgi:hypothetical protein